MDRGPSQECTQLSSPVPYHYAYQVYHIALRLHIVVFLGETPPLATFLATWWVACSNRQVSKKDSEKRVHKYEEKNTQF